MSKDAPLPPAWLDERFFEEALRHAHPDISVTSLVLTPAVAAGENYNCVVFRASLFSSHGPSSLVVKCVPQEESRARYVRECEITVREAQMYQHALPMLEDGKLKFPRCYHVLQDGERDTIVLEDLGQQGYRTHPRQTGLDGPHCREALSQLSRLHGASVALRVKRPEFFKSEIQDNYYDTTYGEKYRGVYISYLNSIFPTLAETIKNNLPLSFNSIGEIIKNMNMNDIYSNIISCSKIEKSDVLVLTHGDFWSNNILYKYNNQNEPEGCALIDFQTSFCASPVLDLLYFLFTSTTQATRRAHMDGLLTLYLDEARKAMRERGVDDPGNMFYKDVADLKKDMDRHKLRAFVDACCVLPVVVAEPGVTLDLRAVSTTSPVFAMFAGEAFSRRLQEILGEFQEMGLFEELRPRP